MMFASKQKGFSGWLWTEKTRNRSIAERAVFALAISPPTEAFLWCYNSMKQQSSLITTYNSHSLTFTLLLNSSCSPFIWVGCISFAIYLDIEHSDPTQGLIQEECQQLVFLVTLSFTRGQSFSVAQPTLGSKCVSHSCFPHSSVIDPVALHAFCENCG
jgi:hypothetical protein